ncbi:hypothetical protein CDL12_16833 [Handroanthus impetiginosus]|uniref:Uncharacterized protein n=1 Tax=Handroanthus impetiginosus TaxID=429701 RepID=A0A2G9GZ79_9LAMI|nr:hypothetical protein CDL12_16833 [Handroanthus impetiginosus]
MDDDLITPISDNEYVLKGSEIFSDTDKTDLSYSEKEILMQKEQSSIQEEAAKYTKTTSFKEDKQSPPSETSILISTRSSSSAIEESSPIFGSEISSLTYDSGKLEVFKNSVTKEQEKQEEISSLLRSKTKKVKINEKSISSKAASADKVHFTKSTSCSDGASHMFRKLITCHAVETNDSAVVTSHKQNRPSLNMCSSNQRDVRSAEMRKREKFGDSHMIFANCNSTQHQRNNSKSSDRAKDSAKKKGELKEQRTPRAAYKPLNGPNCS